MTRETTSLQVRPVQTRHELERALTLVHENYVRRGYAQPTEGPLRPPLQHVLPSTRTFVSLAGEEIVATASVFFDSPLGLPLDRVFGDHTDELRCQGRTLAEVGMLADRRKSLARSMQQLLEMMRRIFWELRREGTEDLLITVHPRHEKFYAKYLGFESYGQTRTYGAVNDAPAQLLRLAIDRAESARVRHDETRELFLAEPPAEDEDAAYRMSADDFREFFADRRERLICLSDQQKRLLSDRFDGRVADLLQAGCAASVDVPKVGWREDNARAEPLREDS
jgi:hypothetical protein